MVGDTYEKDIFPALQAGINVIWFTHKCAANKSAITKNMHVKTINNLNELLDSP